ncbi:MAG: hypothetical protein QOJ22_861 [Thermoleophilaceae bacterium]|nr:hypothetical protein [Thermoleophilaceae bacterium]
MRVEIVSAIIIATLVGPFLIGWWIGNPVFAAAAWGALGLTLLIRQLTAGDGSPEGALVLGIIVGSAISAGAAGYGGHVRERQRARQREEA